MEVTVSQKFDTVYDKAIELLDGDDEGSSKDKDGRVNQCIQDLEQLTVTISRLAMFSKNETFEELSGNTLKFLLLPYLLGSLWQIRTLDPRPNTENGAPSDAVLLRKNICEASQIYFQDFIQRCLDYNIITAEPPVLKLVKQFQENDYDDEGAGDALKQQSDLVAKYFDSSDRREMKVKTFKDKKELDQRIQKLQERKNNGEDLDNDTTQGLYLTLLRRAVHEATSQLESITQELNLIKHQADMVRKSLTGEGTSEAPQSNPYGLPFKTFILTKTDMQKNVFGMGYPSLPVMTVEELYQKRREEGEWPGPPNGEVAHQDSEENPEKDEDEDDPEHLQRQRDMDEFKDMHRRGWGNRMNRS